MYTENKIIFIKNIYFLLTKIYYKNLLQKVVYFHQFYL
jgi:hypothetical protein